MRLRYFAAMATLCVAFASAPAGARHLSIDFGPSSDGDDFGTGTTCAAGSSTPESCAMTLLNDASSGEIPLGFTIDFGTGPVSSLWTNENGIVTFTGPITTSSFSSLASVGRPVIAPFFADLTSVAFVGTVFEMLDTNFGQLMYQRGAATPLPESDGTFDLTKEVPAFSMMWYGLTEPGDTTSTRIFTQVIIYSHTSSAPNDFDIRFLYGSADGDQYNTGTGPSGIAGLLLGTNTLNITGPLLATTDYFYSFRGGKLVGTTPPPPLTLTCPTATAQVGVAYNSALTAAGGVTPYTFSITGSPPAGLTLNRGTGALTGTPTTPGPVTFTAQVVDSSGLAAGTVTSACTITVSPAASKLSVTPASVSFGTVKRYSLHVKTVTLKNTGASAVSLGRPSITPGAGAGRYTFAEVSLCARSLAAGKSCPIYVVLFGDVVGSPSATLNIPNSAVGSPQTVPLSATVTR
jgi:Putative Ig domain